MARRKAGIAFVAALGVGCSARVVDSTDSPTTFSNGAAGTSNGATRNPHAGAISGTGGTAGSTSPPRYPRPIAIDAAAAPSSESAPEARAPVPATVEAGAPAPFGCTVPKVPLVPSAGTGATSHCAPKDCPGIAVNTDLSESWQKDFPASRFAGCTSVSGTVVVAMSSNGDLGELSCLEHVSGDVVIWNNPGLTTLHGLESLLVVDGSLAIGRLDTLSAQNPVLGSVDALSALEVVGKDLVLDLGLPMPDLGGFGAVAAIGGNLAFHSNSARPGSPSRFTDVSGFGALRFVGGDLAFEAVDAVVGTSGFGRLEAIGGSIFVDGATDLGTFAGFPRLSCVGKSLSFAHSYLQENTALRSIGPFPSLQAVFGSIHVEGNPNLESIYVFDTVTRLDGGTLRVIDNPVLAAMPLGRLTWVGDDVSFGGDAALSVCPILDLEARLKAAGYTHYVTITGGLECVSGTECVGPSCAAP